MSHNKKILMSTMSMDIGGAETHILELCKVLMKRGYEIMLVSNGGVYVQALESIGVTHVNAPLHKRNFFSILRAYFIVRGAVKRFKPDIIHAHARIPSFVCSMVNKKAGCKFVTSAHGVFDPAGLKGALTNWGQQTMSVSEDIKDYLIRHYGVNARNIFVTTNGIDTERFSPDVSGDEARSEFSLKDNVIAHVSRLDRATILVAEQLIVSAERLSGEICDLSILIIGGGTEFEYLRRRAEEVNSRLGTECIIMTGPRTDIEKLLAPASIFVGVSRTALEAMSEAKPAIIAGNQGYIGIFDRDRFDISYSTNFCCRGCDPTTTQALTGDILTLMSYTPEKLMSLGKYSRDTIIEYYSSEKMTDDYEEMYQREIQPACKVLISGYYGYKNTGDDAILSSIEQIINRLETPVDAKVLSHKSGNRERIIGFKLINRFNLFTVLHSIRKCDLLISGGGSLLQDKSSTRSLLYYLALIRLAKFFDKRVLLFANGIGPINKPHNRERVKRVVSKADIITLREIISYNELTAMGVQHPEIHVTADPVFLLSDTGPHASQELLSNLGVSGQRPILGISMREMDTTPDFKLAIAELCDYAYSQLNMDVLFVIMQPSNDICISNEIRFMMKHPSFITGDSFTPSEIMGITGQAAVIVSMRLHTILFAAKEHVPVLGIECDPKISHYLQTLDMPSLGDPNHLSRKTSKKALADMLENLEAERHKITSAANKMEASAKNNELFFLRAINLCDPNSN